MNAAPKWKEPRYQRIVSVERCGDQLLVRFEDDARVSIEAQRVLPPETRDVDWDSITFNPYEIIVPTIGGQVEVPWSTVRALTDGEYGAHLASAAEEQARQIGRRIKALRKSRKLTSKELAERAGITPQSLSRIEHGRHDVVFTTLQRILAAMGCSLKDLATEPSGSVSAAS
jgi:DNA-binding Xre family transcriptional regulator